LRPKSPSSAATTTSESSSLPAGSRKKQPESRNGQSDNSTWQQDCTPNWKGNTMKCFGCKATVPRSRSVARQNKACRQKKESVCTCLEHFHRTTSRNSISVCKSWRSSIPDFLPLSDSSSIA
jgi:hypothetical protein